VGDDAEGNAMPDIEVLTSALTDLGESLLWDVDSERLWWEDMLGGLIFSATADGRDVRVWRFPDIVTSLALRSGGGAIVTSRSQIHLFDLDSGETELVHEAEPDGDAVFNFNDGTVDRQGRFVTAMVDPATSSPETFDLVGTLQPRGPIVRVDPDGSAHDLGHRLGLSNGACFSPEGTTLYWGDSWARVIYAYDYDPATGEASNARTHVRFHDDSPPGVIALPDGSTIDAEGAIWVAACHGGEVRRYAPDGSLDRRIPVPVTNPTSVAIGGPDLDTLYVSSMGAAPMAAASSSTNYGPLAGTILAVHGTGARGVPETRFAG
jgi:L-arabinonolactonase